MITWLRHNRGAQLGLAVLVAAVIVGGVVITAKRLHPCAPPRGPGDKIAFDHNQDLYVMDADGANLCRLTTDGANNRNPAWSPDGKQLAFVSTRDNVEGIYVMQSDGSNVRLLRAIQINAKGGPAWSPDGKYLAFITGGNPALSDVGSLSVMAVDGSNVRQVTGGSFDGRVSWSPNGQSLAAATFSNATFGPLAIVAADGSGLRLVTPAGGAEVNSVAWSPDGQRLAFDTSQQVCLVNPDGSNEHCLDGNLSSGLKFNAFPAWSPDSRRIAFFSSDLGANYGMYVMNADGSNVIRLAKNDGRDLAWSP